MTQLKRPFPPGDRIALLYLSVGANGNLGTVTQISAISMFVHVDGLLRAKQFSFRASAAG
jgi:hypothetical protein